MKYGEYRTKIQFDTGTVQNITSQTNKFEPSQYRHEIQNFINTVILFKKRQIPAYLQIGSEFLGFKQFCLVI